MSDVFKHIKSSASVEVTRLAEEMRQNGDRVYPLSIGDTHFSPPKIMSRKLIEAVETGRTHYTQTQGILEFRETISNYYLNNYSPSEILITAGLKEALYSLLFAIGPKKVCILEPTWLGYQSTCDMLSEETVAINCYKENWLGTLKETDFDAIIICCPNNPDGRIFTADELEEIRQIAEAKNSYIILDEIYSHFKYNDEKKANFSKFYSMEKAVIANGLSKSHAMTGLRIGYLLVKDKELMRKLLLVQQNLSTCANSVGQYAGIGYIEALEEVSEFRDYYALNRLKVAEIIPELNAFMPDGGFYYFFNLKAFGKNDAMSFCKELLRKEKIALVPGGAYGIGFDDWIRLSFSVERTLLVEAVEKLSRFLRS